MTQHPDPTHDIARYLGIPLSKENKFFLIKNNQLFAISNANVAEQTFLFSKVISLLLSSKDDSFVELLEEYDEVAYEEKAKIITSIFYSRIPTHEIDIKVHCNKLAAALMEHHLMHLQPLLYPPSDDSCSPLSSVRSSDTSSYSSPHLSPNTNQLIINTNLAASDIPKFKLPIPFHVDEDLEAKKFFEGLTKNGLEYCRSLWIFEVTQSKDEKEIFKHIKSLTSKGEVKLIDNSKFNTPKNLILLLQKKILDKLNGDILIFDIYRSFKYTTVIDSNNKIRFKYKNSIGIPNSSLYDHDCVQFKKFLCCLLTLVYDDDDPEEHYVIDLWNSCIEKSKKDCEDILFIDALQEFLPEIKNTIFLELLRTYKQESNAISYQLLLLLTHLKFTLSDETCQTFEFNFGSNNEVKINLNYNCSAMINKETTTFNVTTVLQRTLLSFTPWSSKIGLEIIASNASSKSLKKRILKPFEKIGLRASLSETKDAI